MKTQLKVFSVVRPYEIAGDFVRLHHLIRPSFSNQATPMQ